MDRDEGTGTGYNVHWYFNVRNLRLLFKFFLKIFLSIIKDVNNLFGKEMMEMLIVLIQNQNVDLFVNNNQMRKRGLKKRMI